MGDVVADGMTWITYGNDIIARQTTDPKTIGAEAQKAAMNINTFLANRGTELDTVSPGAVTKLDDMVDKLASIAAGNLVLADDSFLHAAGEEFSSDSELARQLKAGAQAVANTPGQVYDFLKDQGKKALDEAKTPLLIIVAGVIGVAYIMYGKKK